MNKNAKKFIAKTAAKKASLPAGKKKSSTKGINAMSKAKKSAC